MCDYDVMPDGQRFLFNIRRTAELLRSPISIISNWRVQLNSVSAR
jgi:hypothetical protein